MLIDVAGFKGVEMLGDNYEITVADLEGALKKQNLTLQPGDAVIVHTGWASCGARRTHAICVRARVPGVAAAQWLIGKDPMLLGSDNWPVEVAPIPTARYAGPPDRAGGERRHLLGNLNLDELAAKGVPEFAFVMQPLKICGQHGRLRRRSRLKRNLFRPGRGTSA